MTAAGDSPFRVIDFVLAEIAEHLRGQPSSPQAREWRARASKCQVVIDSWKESAAPTDAQIEAMTDSVMDLHAEVVGSSPVLKIKTVAPPPSTTE